MPTVSLETQPLRPLPRTWHPDSCQTLLLKAAILPAPAALAAWNAWKTQIDIDHLDEGSYQILPRLYRQLESLGVGDPLMPRLKSVYRHVWSRNQVNLHTLSEVVGALQARDISACLLWGPAMVLGPEADRGIRRTDDAGLWVRWESMPAAMTVLQALGWMPTQRKAPELLRTLQPAVGLYKSGKPGFTLHWHISPECCQPDVEAGIWQLATTVSLGDQAVRLLDATDQFFFCCVRATQWQSIPPFYWLADAAALVQAHAIDWPRVVAQAQSCGLTWTLAQAMTPLAQLLDCSALNEALETLNQEPFTRFERAEFLARSKGPAALGSLPLLWFQYQRLAARSSQSTSVIGFGRFLQRQWGLAQPWQIPLHLLRQSGKRLQQKVLRIPFIPGEI